MKSTNQQFSSTVIAAIAAFTLTACGGSSNGTRDDGPGRTPSGGATPPVNIPVVNVKSIHLEMTDVVNTLETTVVAIETSSGNIFADDYIRDEVLCPGVPPVGNECTLKWREVDGTLYELEPNQDMSIEVHEKMFNDMSHSVVSPINGVQAFRGQLSAGGLDFNLYGGWGEYSAFYSVVADIPGTFDRTWSASFGNLYSGKPTEVQGGANWYGGMVGHTRAGGVELEGESRVFYHFQTETVDVRLTDINESSRARQLGQLYSGPSEFTWIALTMNNDGSFFHIGNHDESQYLDFVGIVDGDFFGPNAEEVAGVFEKDGVVGAFGGKRER